MLQYYPPLKLTRMISYIRYLKSGKHLYSQALVALRQSIFIGPILTIHTEKWRKIAILCPVLLSKKLSCNSSDVNTNEDLILSINS